MLTIRRTWIPLATAILALAAFSAQAQQTTFSAKLTGAAILPEPVDTKAEGEFKLVASADGKKLSYTLTVTNLKNAAAADMHLGPPIANGPAVARLFPTKSAPPRKGDFSGVLAEGTLDASDLTGPLAGSPLSDLIQEIRDGNAYVNVHTNDSADPPNSGPGDYRLGEIRGQIQ
jgi:hypothetical protein